MKIARPGFLYIAAGCGIALCGACISAAGAGRAGLFVAFLGAAFAASCAYFFRDPDRPLPSDESKIYSPGDGRVLSLEREGNDGTWTLRIFLSLFDVHVQRFPCSGTVSKVERRKGSFVMAMRAGASLNERVIVGIRATGRADEIEVEQITGFIARRIQCRTREGGRAAAGERYGLIHFGSQVALRLPASVRPLVKPGDLVLGGTTAVGEWGGLV
jgi:phosphatidylserine decarboxylase